MTTPTPKPEKWQRWSTGRFRLYLDSGSVLDFSGKVRTKTNVDGVTDYEAASESVEMFPHFSDVEAIERLGA